LGTIVAKISHYFFTNFSSNNYNFIISFENGVHWQSFIQNCPDSTILALATLGNAAQKEMALFHRYLGNID